MGWEVHMLVVSRMVFSQSIKFCHFQHSPPPPPPPPMHALKCALSPCYVPLRSICAAVNYALRCISCCPPPSQWGCCFAFTIAWLRAQFNAFVPSVRTIKALDELVVVPNSRLTLPKRVRVVEALKPIRGERTFGRDNADPRETPPSSLVVLYFHGGGFALCSPGTHRSITAKLLSVFLKRHGSEYPDAALFSVDYRKAPNHPYPAR